MASSADVLIVGAGFAGAVCAERLAAAGRQVLIIDQRDHVGGNAYDCLDSAGIRIHRYGAHVFHTRNQRVVEYLSRFTSWHPYEHRVLAHLEDGRFVPIPINDTTLEAFAGDEAAARAALYEPYTRKQWGEAAEGLLPHVIARVQPRQGRDDRYFTDSFQAMPADGYTRLFERMLDHPRITVRVSTPFTTVQAMTCAQQVIWTGPIDTFFAHCFGALPYRSASFFFRTLDGVQRHQPVGVVNYPSLSVGYTRVIEFTHLTGQIAPDTSIALEYPSATGDPFWPVPTAENLARYAQYRDLARRRTDVHFVGRLGTYKYIDMDVAVAQALQLTARLIKEDRSMPENLIARIASSYDWLQPSNPTASPKPVTTPPAGRLDFYDALRLVANGAQITRVAWDDVRVRIYLDAGLLRLRKADGTIHNLIVSDGDLMAEDWRVVPVEEAA